MFEDDNTEDFTFKINEGYAKKFEHNKKREELHRCEYYPIHFKHEHTSRMIYNTCEFCFLILLNHIINNDNSLWI